MRWQRFFEDLEHQLDSEWEAERAALDTEAERLRLSRLTLRERVAELVDTEVAIDVVAADAVRGRVTGAGADWLGIESAAGLRAAVVPLAAVASVAAAESDLLRSARPSGRRPALAERMTLGFVLRDLARRRVGVRIAVAGNTTWTGTIDRAGADHLDLALHGAGEHRRTSAITGHRMIAYPALQTVHLDGGNG
ncbi:hypothetical protein [Microbacterium arborescens]|uniref:hypothetical protein n=1 Tax=Microbacterium arborescens TaxID=33883 RepID=UPI0025A23BCA|nr:hypothetical protein [Microbacterium arborescens]WJM14969.1 hypothetical protein QUC20_11870 [Microbacterium arborescens]